MKKPIRRYSLYPLIAIAILCGMAQLARAYHAFVAGSGTVRWTASVFSTDLTGVTLPNGSPVSTATPNPTPNNNQTGLLYVVDFSENGTDCASTADIYSRNSSFPYAQVYDALGELSSVSGSALNLQYVCHSIDLTLTQFDGNPDAGDIFRTDLGTFALNNYNEIVFDDTTNFDMCAAIFGSFCVSGITQILAIGLPLDSAGNLGGFDPAFNGTISEAFVLVNMTPQTPIDTTNLEGTLVHELGHTLGAAHSNSIMNAAAIVGGTTFNNGNSTGDPCQLPTMYAFVISGLCGGQDPAADLAADDIALFQRQYPAGAGCPSGTGSISGQVLDTNSAPIDGASVIAYNTNDEEIGVIVGGNPALANGNYKIDCVPTGSYKVTLRKLDGSTEAGLTSATNTIDAIFPSPDLCFAQAYRTSSGISTQESSAATVTVSNGADTSGIDFVGVTLLASNCSSLGNGGAGVGTGPLGVVDLVNSGGCSAVPNLPLSSLTSFLPLLAPFAALRIWRKQKRA